jgi:hypothetical protein
MRLKRLGFVTVTAGGPLGFQSDDAQFCVSEKWKKLQTDFDIRLSRLASIVRGCLLCEPLFGEPMDNRPCAEVFVVMPFLEKMQAIYKNHIRPTVRGFGKSCARADNLFGPGPVMRDIWSAIAGAEVIIGDCTGRNPNVFYEIGIAHTIGKPVVLLTQNKRDVPFDVRAIRYIKYDITRRGRNMLEENLRKTLQVIESGQDAIDIDLWQWESMRE